jgi:hypothetical protein
MLGLQRYADDAWESAAVVLFTLGSFLVAVVALRNQE